MLIVLVMALFIACETSVEPEVIHIPQEAPVEEEPEPEPEPEAEEPEAAEEPGTAADVCELYGPIDFWTVRVTEQGCLILSYSWEFDDNDWQEQDRVDHEFTVLLRYLWGWAVKHNRDHATEYAVEYRRNR